ncbi:hypothetical protein [Lentzea sp. CA-135723]|uniref:hypothetical protein n=1 Tax=Lentzea sp. CA-135723 TaxID=3239950 RepID=UPI003D9343A1
MAVPAGKAVVITEPDQAEAVVDTCTAAFGRIRVNTVAGRRHRRGLRGAVRTRRVRWGART